MENATTTPWPVLVPGVDIRSLPLGPEEAFVASRVDGRSSPQDIAAATGLEARRVSAALARLEQLGAVRTSLQQPDPPPRSPPVGRSSSSALRWTRPAVEVIGSPPADPGEASALYDPAELDEPAELDLPRKRRILDVYYALGELDHYALLGVPRDADKKAIKEAYFEAVKIFHPDRYYGKQLGSFAHKLAAIFQQATEAHDTLSRKRTREEYDAYLSLQSRNRAREALLSDDPGRALELERVRRSIEEAARREERAPGPAPRPSTPSTPAVASAAGASQQASDRPSAPSAPPARPLDPDERRRALARKLGLSTASRSSAPPPVVDRQAQREHVAEDLRRRYEQRLAAGRAQQAARYRDAAEQALAQGDPVAATNALRLALQLQPDAAVERQLEQVQAHARAELAASYLEQARYEERVGRFAEAARSYERAASGKAEPTSLERAAFCLLAASGDVRKAVTLARAAVLAAPDLAVARVTLARAYLKAGMHQSAVGEIERAEALAPNDDTVKEWARRLRKGEF